MSTFCELQLHGLLRRLRPELLLMLLGVWLAGCSSGSSDEPAPAPPAPPPPPPPGPSLPPVSSTPIPIDDGHTVGAIHWPDGDTSVGGQGQPVAGLECGVMDETYHVHSHLSIFLNGEALAVPRPIGIIEPTATTGCTYPIHTHDMSGRIHVEAPAPATFTLGQLFAIWGQPLTSSDIAGLMGMPVVVYVTDNGVVTQNTGDWSAIELTSHREITIQVGTPITEIPNFTWTGD